MRRNSGAFSTILECSYFNCQTDTIGVADVILRVAVSKRVSPGDIARAREGRHNFCFIDFSTAEQVKAALAAVNGTHYRGEKLRISWSKNQGGVI